MGLSAGLNAEQLATELTLATIVIENNFEQSAKSLKKGQKDADEDDEEISFLSHLQETTGKFGDTKRGRSKERAFAPQKRSTSPSELMESSLDGHMQAQKDEQEYRSKANTSFLGKAASLFREACLRQSANDIAADHGRRQVDKTLIGIAKDLRETGSIDSCRWDELQDALPMAVLAATQSFGGGKGNISGKTQKGSAGKFFTSKTTSGAKTTVDYRHTYMTSEPSKSVRVKINNTLTVDGGTRTLSLEETTARTLALWGRAQASKSSTPGGVIRADAIPNGSQLEYLAPGRVKFDGVEFRAVRNLGHLSEADLVRMSKTGVAPRDIKELPIEGHHHLQQYHRDPGAFVVEIPEPNHCISNSIQHPLGTTGGLSEVERADWTRLRRAYYKERAKTELLKRNSLNG